jgi:hypothetical protein
MATQFSINDQKPWKAPFFTIWGGQAISIVGSQLVQFALIWYLTVETGSATVLATAAIVGMLPQVILGPFVGTLVDRWNRRRIMLLADSTITLFTFLLTLQFALNDVAIWHIYVVMFVRSLAGSFHGNAMSASTSLMVPVEHLTRIQGLNQMLNGGLNVVSAPLGALLLGILPIQGVLLIDVGTALLAILPLCFIQVPQPERLAGFSVRIPLLFGLAWPAHRGSDDRRDQFHGYSGVFPAATDGEGVLRWKCRPPELGGVCHGNRDNRRRSMAGCMGWLQTKDADVDAGIDGVGRRYADDCNYATLGHSDGCGRRTVRWHHDPYDHGAILCHDPIRGGA